MRADQLATLARTSLSPLPLLYQSINFPRCNIQLYINEYPIHKWNNPSIHQAATTDAFLNHIKTKFRWTSNLYKEIDWNAKAKIMKQVPANIKPWLLKLGTDRLPLLGEKFTHSPTNMCPMCNLHKETPNHFLLCSYYKRHTDQQNQQLIDIMNNRVRYKRIDAKYQQMAFESVPTNPYLESLVKRN